MKRNYFIMIAGLLVFAPPKMQTSTPQTLPLTQIWTNTGLITANDDWSGVMGIQGFLGDYTASSPTAVDPQTILVDMATIDVIANQVNPNTQSTGGVVEFHIADPVIALQGSGTADAPNIILYLNTNLLQNIHVGYTIRDIDGSADDAVQAVALQYRIGNTGNFTNLSAGFVADATTGPALATLVTPVSATLPATCNNQAEVQVRIITSNAAGNDEWVGIDDIIISGQALIPTPVNIISFSGYRLANRCHLSWTTSSESNNVGFEVQRSVDGVNYTVIGFVNTRAPGGNSVVNQDYNFTDNTVTGNKQFYRLRQVDIDSRSRFSNVVLIKGDKPVTLAIDGLFPNPVNTVVNVLIAAPDKDRVILVVTDPAGRVVIQLPVNVETGINTIPVNISHLGNGAYMVKLVCNSDCQMAVGKFVKQ